MRQVEVAFQLNRYTTYRRAVTALGWTGLRAARGLLIRFDPDRSADPRLASATDGSWSPYVTDALVRIETIQAVGLETLLRRHGMNLPDAQ